MTFGPVQWVQCPNDATVILTVVQDGETTDQPACNECWQEAIERSVVITQTRPMTEDKG